ncbi:fatty acid hydroxylase domain-containing protein 2-like [Argopecten irradians]|uniref:fatty acid hydroxylase domain-containing protein 2-like n=1 Tax=Argopecten irradians TaxID=31199 RepID=UPI00371A7A7F
MLANAKDPALGPTQSEDVHNQGLSRKDRIKAKGVTLMDSIKKGLFVVGSALIVFSAFRNSVTWHLHNVWGASGHFWQGIWNSIYDLFGDDNIWLGTLGTTIFTFVVFWAGNILLLILDTTGWPAFLLKYKIQEDQNVPVDRKKLLKAVNQVLFNQIIVGIPFSYTFTHLMIWRGCQFHGGLPSFTWVIFELIIFSLVEEVGFYYTHRLFHHPKLYRFIHKRHHEWTAPIGIIALYAHPVEHCLSNLAPIALGPVITGSHVATAWMWFALALWSTTVSHSGYHFPGLPSPEAHDFHHLKFTQNYGVLGVLDRLHGTDNQFREHIAYKRHILSLSAVPMSQQFPNPANVKGK